MCRTKRKEEHMRTYKIHFIRHGLTDGNFEGRYIGVTDIPLSEDGADELEAIRQKGMLPETDLVFSSPLKRCVESCRILFPDREPVIIDEMREFDFGEFEGKSARELDGKPEYIAWTSGRACPPGGEESGDFVKRLAVGLNKMVRQMMNDGIYEATAVMHGGVIMTLFASCALPQHKAVEWSSPVGSGYTALITPSLYGRSGVIEIVDTVPSSMQEQE